MAAVVPWAVSAETRRVRRAMRDLLPEHRVTLSRAFNDLPVDEAAYTEAKAALKEALS